MHSYEYGLRSQTTYFAGITAGSALVHTALCTTAVVLQYTTVRFGSSTAAVPNSEQPRQKYSTVVVSYSG